MKSKVCRSNLPGHRSSQALCGARPRQHVPRICGRHIAPMLAPSTGPVCVVRTKLSSEDEPQGLRIPDSVLRLPQSRLRDLPAIGASIVAANSRAGRGRE